MFIKECLARFSFWYNADRIGPDMPLTHWMLYFPSLGRALCRRKFKHIDPTVEIRPGCYVISCSKISLGRRLVIHPGSALMADPREGGHGITIEDDVMMGQGVHIYVDNHAFHDTSRPLIDQEIYPSKPVVIRKGAWIGANAVILSGVEIGENSVIGAGSVINKDIPAHTVVTPAAVRMAERHI